MTILRYGLDVWIGFANALCLENPRLALARISQTPGTAFCFKLSSRGVLKETCFHLQKMLFQNGQAKTMETPRCGVKVSKKVCLLGRMDKSEKNFNVAYKVKARSRCVPAQGE